MARLGIVTTWFDRGAAYVSKAFRDALETAGHEVFIYARGGEHTSEGSRRWDGPRVHWARRLPLTEIDTVEFESWHATHQIEAVVFNEQQDWPIIDFCSSQRIKTIGYVDYYTADTIPLFDKYDVLICNTLRHYSVFRSHRNSHFIQWGTNTELFTPAPKPAALKDKFVFFHNGGMLGVNGRKGTREVVSAFANAIAPKYPQAVLVLHTQVSLDINHPQIRCFSGSFPPPGFYTHGDVYVYPSKLEGIGLTIAEAMSSGLPVITTATAPMNEFITDGENGRLITVDNLVSRDDGYYWPEAVVSIPHLAELMAFYLDNPGVRDRHARNARSAAVTKFNWHLNGAALPRIVEGIL